MSAWTDGSDPYANRSNGHGNGHDTSGGGPTGGTTTGTGQSAGQLHEIQTFATAMHEGRRYGHQASGIWLSAGGEGYVMRLDQATGKLDAFDKNGAIVPPLVEDLHLHPVNFGRMRLKAEDQKPRGWLLGNWLCREFVSSLVGDGAAGKTALRLLCALKLASGRRDILPSPHLFERVPVLFLCFEDSTDELYRRLKAAMKHYEIGAADIDGYLWVEAITEARMKLVLEDELRQRRIGPLKNALDRIVTRSRTRGARPPPCRDLGTGVRPSRRGLERRVRSSVRTAFPGELAGQDCAARSPRQSLLRRCHIRGDRRFPPP
jgi:hypothetical protein